MSDNDRNRRPGPGIDFYIGILWGLTAVALMVLLGWGVYELVEMIYG